MLIPKPVCGCANTNSNLKYFELPPDPKVFEFQSYLKRNNLTLKKIQFYITKNLIQSLIKGQVHIYYSVT